MGITYRNTLFIRSILFIALLFSIASSVQARQQLHGHLLPEFSNAPIVDEVADTQVMHLVIGLPLRNPDGLNAFLRDVYNPGSSNYRHFLNPYEFAERFGATKQDYQSVQSFITANHWTVTQTHPNQFVISAEASAGDVARTLHIKLVHRLRTDGTEFYSPDREPSLDLQTSILHIAGLDDFARPAFEHIPDSSIKKSRYLHGQRAVSLEGISGKVTNSGSGYGNEGDYQGNDFRDAYCNGVPTNIEGSEQSIGIFAEDGFYQEDITNYEGTASPPLSIPNTPLAKLVGEASGGVFNVGENLEVSLDVEMAISMAPEAQVIVYEGLSPYDGGNYQSSADAVLTEMASPPLCMQLSCSWYQFGDATDATLFSEFAAQGQGFFLASGDQGAMGSGDIWSGVPPPGCVSSCISEVGGTQLTTSNSNPLSYNSETTWNTGGGSSGGGICNGIDFAAPNFTPTLTTTPSPTPALTYYTPLPIPVYQSPISMATNGGSTMYRNIPDVACVAYNLVVFASNGYYYEGEGGTSAAAPLWAAFEALVNQQAAFQGLQPLGFANPAFYKIGQSPSYTSVFHNIADGSNNNDGGLDPTYYTAVAGYNLTTGWGSPNGMAMINALLGTIPTPTPTLTVSPIFSASPTASPSPTVTPTVTLVPGTCCESGATWQTDTTTAAFGKRYWAESTVYNNAMWIFGGYSGSAPYRDVWNSTGSTWNQVATSTPLGYRNSGAAVVFDPGDGNGPRMWIIAGQIYEESPSLTHDVWSSFNGITWTEVNASAPFAGGACQALVYNGELWVFPSDGSAWYSSNGSTWTESTSAGGWGQPGAYANAVVYNGAMWVINSNGTTDQVWTSTGGAWTSVTVTTPFPPRTAFVATAVCGQMWVASGLGSSYDNDVWTSTNGAVWTLATADGAYTARDNASSAVFNNTVWLLGGDNASGGSAEVDNAVCDENLTPSVTSTVSPSSTSSPTATFSGTPSFTQTPSPTESQTPGTPTTTMTPPATLTPEACCESGATWQTDTTTAAFGKRYWAESTVYNNAMWIFGGYSGSAPYRDVWNSTGSTWNQVATSTPLGYRNSGAAVVFDPGDGNGPRMWIIAGQIYEESPSLTHDVWSSFNGITWTEVNASAPFAGGACQALVYNGELWVFPSDGSAWYSSNGSTWTESTSAGGWGQPGAYANAVVYNGAMWVINSNGTTDQVWTSTGGAWTPVTVTAPFTARTAFVATAVCGQMWVTSGLGSGYDNDVWTSTNGSVWTLATADGAYTARDYASSVVFNNTVWLLGGDNASGGSAEVDNAVCDESLTTPSVTATTTWTLTATPSQTPSETVTMTATDTATLAGTDTPSATDTKTSTSTPTASVTPTDTRSGTPTRSATPTPTGTRTASPTKSATPTDTGTRTDTATRTGTPTLTDTRTASPTRTATATATPTRTASFTRTPSFTVTPAVPGALDRSADVVLAKATNTPTVSGFYGTSALLTAPNPGHDQVLACFHLADPGSVELLLFNLNGQVVRRWDLGSMDAGAHEAGLNLSSFANGIYFLSLNLDQGLGYRSQAVFKVALIH